MKRLQEHKEKTIPVIEKYKENHEVCVIDGMPTFKEVLESLSNEIERSFKDV